MSLLGTLGMFLHAVRGRHVRGPPFVSVAAWVPNTQHTTHNNTRHIIPNSPFSYLLENYGGQHMARPAAVFSANALLRILVPVLVCQCVSVGPRVVSPPGRALMRVPALLTTWVFVGCCAEGLKKGRVVMAAF